MLQSLRSSALAIAVAMSLVSQPLWAASSSELHLTDLHYTLTDVITGQASTEVLTLTHQNVFSYVDGSASLSARVSEGEPYAEIYDAYYREAPVALTLPRDDAAYASLPRASASISVQTFAGQTRIDAQGQHSGDGSYSAIASLDQGSWGLFFGPPGQGLLLPANTTLTVSTNVSGSLLIDGQCPLDTELAMGWCDSASAYAYLELNYISLDDHQSSKPIGDLFHFMQLTEVVGQGAQQSQSRLLSVSLTNPTEQAMQITFRYKVQLDGRSVQSAVPEPSSWALLCAGLLLVSCAAVRARRNQS